MGSTNRRTWFDMLDWYLCRDSLVQYPGDGRV